MNYKFSDYFRDNFFGNEDELKSFLQSLTKSLVKTIRINTNKIEVKDILKRLTNNWFDIKKTFQDNVFYIQRWENFSWIEKRLWFSLEHLLWYFYIQELWASSSVFYLSSWKIDYNNYLILDVASSPWWKTTQLAEYYPNSFIVANEFDKNRTPQLIANTERMWLSSYWITNYNWQFLWRQKEVFDKILLDAPCSWEWTGFKSLDALKFRNLKNVKKISELQKKLIESSFNALKIGWELLYSTCTMNKIENEWVIEYLISKYQGSLEIEFEKRFWPHIDETWWFYVCKIKKIKSIEYKNTEKKELYNDKIKELSNKEVEIVKSFFKKLNIDSNDLILLKYETKIITIWNKKSSVNIPYSKIYNKLFFFKLWKEIWNIINSEFVPSPILWRDFWKLNIMQYEIKNEQELDNYLRWFEIWENLKKDKEEYIQISYNWDYIWLSEINDNWKIKNNFPKIWLRK